MLMRMVKINATKKTPTAPRMPDAPRKRGEGLVVGVAVVEPVTILEDTDARMVPPAMVVVGITAVIDVGEAVGMMKTINCIVF